MIGLDELIKHYECLDKVTIWSQGTWVGRSKDARCAEDAGMQAIWDVHLGCRDAEMLICREAIGFWLFLVAILDFCANYFANWRNVLPWCSRFCCPGATLQSHKDYFCAFNSHLPCTPNINIDIYNNNRNVSILSSKDILLMKFKYFNHPKQSGRQDVRSILPNHCSNLNKIWIQT